MNHRLVVHAGLFPGVALAALLVLAAPARAAWPINGTPVCTVVTDQRYPEIIPDGSGGAIVTWADYRSGTSNDIYAQHVLSSGAPDPAWPLDGLVLCAAVDGQIYPTLASDGAGGAIVAWYDYRSGTSYDIYAQHVTASGSVDPGWPVNGRALCTASGDQTLPRVLSDGAHGAIVAWMGPADYPVSDISAQHVLATGLVDPAWPVNGRSICSAPGAQQYPRLVTDGAGGAIITWEDVRGGTYYDIYAQRVQASGSVDPAWPANGRAVCTAANSQLDPAILSDGAGGALISWSDFRNTFGDVYAQHVLASGVADPAWPANGRALCSAANHQYTTALVSDGSTGAIVAWQDYRNGTDFNIYAQHVLISGVVDAGWPVDGTALTVAANTQESPAIVTDRAGGAVVAWLDSRDLATTSSDVYAQHVLASGLVDATWPAGGKALCTAPNFQQSAVTAPDGAGGAIAAWTDLRNENTTGVNIFAQRIGADGTIGGAVAGVSPGARATGVAFAPASPNPARFAVTLDFVLPRDAQVRLGIFDISGATVRELFAGRRGAGTQAEGWDLRTANGKLAHAGMYFARLEVEGQRFVQRFAVTR